MNYWPAVESGRISKRNESRTDISPKPDFFDLEKEVNRTFFEKYFYGIEMNLIKFHSKITSILYLCKLFWKRVEMVASCLKFCFRMKRANPLGRIYFLSLNLSKILSDFYEYFIKLAKKYVIFWKNIKFLMVLHLSGIVLLQFEANF